MELEKLRIFKTLAEEKSYSAAAEKLFISHSTVSRAVTALEQELGVRLAERDNRFIALTRDGEKLYRGACELLDKADELKNSFRKE